MWCIISVIALSIITYWYGIKPYNYWKRKKVPCVKPLPFIGNCGPMVFRQKSLATLTEDIYNSFPDEKYVGFYQFTNPGLMIRDPDLIKTITIKEFEVFPTRQLVVSDTDPMWGKSLVSVQDLRKWQDIRTSLSPAFNSGNLKLMFALLKDCAHQFTHHFHRQGKVTTDVKVATSKYTNDIFATIVFGITCNSFENPHNEFYVMSKEMCNFKGINGLRFLIHIFSSKLAKITKIGIVSAKAKTYFTDVVDKSIKIRETMNMIRPDVIHLLLKARSGEMDNNKTPVIDSGCPIVRESVKPSKNRKTNISNLDIAANAVLFLIGGVESTSSFLYFTCYELAVHLDIQHRLRREVEQAYDKCGGDISYEALLGMNYLDMVLSEVLRLWPSSPVISRKSCKPFTITTTTTELTLDAGTDIMIPSYALQRDGKYFPNPNKFDPERFNDENKRYINTSVYLPFGSGRKSCIGSRLALLMNKLLITEILMKFEIFTTEETSVPPVIEGGSVFLPVKGGHLLELKPRHLT